MGLASAFLEYIRIEYPDALHRLESENENDHAMEVYRNKGFSELPYVETVRNSCESAPEDNECFE
jgi:ribosomal protein S18 acetylase RimI-like enzyme